MSVIYELDRRVRVVPLERLRARGHEYHVVLSPHRKERRLVLSEILLKLGIHLHVGPVIHQELKLDLGVTGPRHEVVVQMVRLRGDRRRVRRAMLVLQGRD